MKSYDLSVTALENALAGRRQAQWQGNLELVKQWELSIQFWCSEILEAQNEHS